VSIAGRLASIVTTTAAPRAATPFILDISALFIQSDKVMKTKTLLALFAVVSAASIIIAQTSNYTAVEAAKHVGETATVTDRVDGVHQSGKGNIFLNMGGKYPNQSFTAFIPSSSAAQFSQPQQYEGRTVSVSGKITLYHGKPEIIVNSPSQISAK
jgi:DNA/RNA endonuclease YhcR with UshA esterase domain